MEMLTERPSAPLASLNKDVSDGSIVAGCQSESPSADAWLQLGSAPSGGTSGKVTAQQRHQWEGHCPAEAPVGRPLPSHRPAPLLCTHIRQELLASWPWCYMP